MLWNECTLKDMRLYTKRRKCKSYLIIGRYILTVLLLYHKKYKSQNEIGTYKYEKGLPGELFKEYEYLVCVLLVTSNKVHNKIAYNAKFIDTTRSAHERVIKIGISRIKVYYSTYS